MTTYGYHSTFLGRLESIARQGLRTSGGSQFGGGYSGHSRGRVFLSGWEGVSFWMSKMEDIANANSDFDDEESVDWTPVVLRVDITDLADRLGEDELGYRDSGYQDSWYVEEDIPADLIEVWDGDNWVDVRRADVGAMQGEALDAAEYESDEDEPEDEWGEPSGWYSLNFDLFEPSRKASKLEAPPAMVQAITAWAQKALATEVLRGIDKARRKMLDPKRRSRYGDEYADEVLVALETIRRKAQALGAREPSSDKPSPVERTFKLDIRGWRYADVLQAARADDPNRFDHDWGTAITAVYDPTRSARQGRAEYTRTSHTPTSYLLLRYPAPMLTTVADFDGVMADLAGAIRHELQHHAQYLLSLGSGAARAGLPGGEGFTHEEVYDVSPGGAHALMDVEFYTRLQDDIDTFNRTVRPRIGPRGNSDALRQAVRIWTADAPSQDIGLIRVQPSEFFAALRKHAPAKWRKAVGDFYQEVMGTSASRVATRYVEGVVQHGPRNLQRYYDILARRLDDLAQNISTAYTAINTLPLKLKREGWDLDDYKRDIDSWLGEVTNWEVDTYLLETLAGYNDRTLKDLRKGFRDDIHYLKSFADEGSRIRQTVDWTNDRINRVVAEIDPWADRAHKLQSNLAAIKGSTDVFAKSYSDLPPTLIDNLAAIAAAWTRYEAILTDAQEKLGEFLRATKPRWESEGEYVPEHADVETLYHATTNARELLAKGFTPGRHQPGIGLGGGGGLAQGQAGISFTSDIYVAKEIARAFKEAKEIADGRVKAADIMDWARRARIDAEVNRLYRGLHAEDWTSAQSPGAVFELYRLFLIAHPRRYSPGFFQGDPNRYMQQLRGVNAKDIGVLVADVDLTNPDILYFGAEREFRVPPEAVLNIKRILR